MLQAKGPLFKGTLKYIKEKYGTEKLEEILKKLPEETKKIFKKPILDSMFYPAEHLIALNIALINPADPEAKKIYKEIGRFSGEQAYHGIYKLLFKVGTPKFMVGRASNIWKTYYSQGELRTVDEKGNNMKILIINSGINHISLCARIEGFIEKVVELTGGKNPHTNHTSCFINGSNIEEWHLSWE